MVERDPYALSTRRKGAARWSVSTIFFITGCLVASWVLHIPYVQNRLVLSEGVLGLALLGTAFGSVIAMPLTGWLVGRYGSGRITRAALVSSCLTLPLPVLAPGFWTLVLALIVFGACNGSLDVSMNAQAVAVEGAYRRPIMSAFHGLFSFGGLVGASLGGLALTAGLSPHAHLIAVMISMGILAAVSQRFLLPREIDPPSDGPTFVRPTGPLFGLGALAFLVLVAEGAMADWSAVYLRNYLGTGPGLAAGGFAAFSLTMALGRFTGDRVVAGYGPVRLARNSAVVAATGLGLALLVGHPTAALAGFACVGLGLSNQVPLLFRAAGRIPGISPGVGIASVSTAGYFGFLAGPPVIGLMAEFTGLPAALGLVVASIALVAVFAYRLRPAPEHGDF